jgi:hypothetical protein
MTWSLFESKCFSGFMKAKQITLFAERVLKEGIPLEALDATARHFHQRFQDKGKLSNLLHDDKTPAEVAAEFKECLSAAFTDLQSSKVVFLIVFLVYRYRNNMFYGNKGIGSWLKYGKQIRLCTNAMQAFVSYAESVSPTMSTRAAS